MYVRALVLALLVGGCTDQVQGPPADLEAIATPAPLERREEQPPGVPQADPPPLQSGTFRAWEPPTQGTRGESTEGRWVTISDTAPPLEKIAPDKLIPRAPHALPAAKPAKDRAVPQPVTPPRQAPPAALPTLSPGGIPTLPPGGIPGLPPGLMPGLPGGQQ